jgi:hypothetical protein
MEPIRLDKQQPDSEIERIVRDRLATFEKDQKSAKDAREAIAEVRRRLTRHPAPPGAISNPLAE